MNIKHSYQGCISSRRRFLPENWGTFENRGKKTYVQFKYEKIYQTLEKLNNASSEITNQFPPDEGRCELSLVRPALLYFFPPVGH